MSDEIKFDPLVICLQITLQNSRKFLGSRKFQVFSNTLSYARDAKKDDRINLIRRMITILSKRPETRVQLIMNIHSMGINLRGLVPEGTMQSLERKSIGLNILVCPVDPTHYQKPSPKEPGGIKCPLHGVDLISMKDA